MIAEETGVANVADPLGGSWYVEALTDRIEAQAEAIFAQIRELGRRRHPDGAHPIGPITSGLLAGVESGWFTGHIADAAFEYQQALEDGRKRVVGVNVHTDADRDPLEILRVSHEVERDQVAHARPARRRRATRPRSRRRWRSWPRRPATDANLVPLLIDAARAGGDPGRDVRGAARPVGHLPRARLTPRPGHPADARRSAT